jgi:hypothetical protein
MHNYIKRIFIISMLLVGYHSTLVYGEPLTEAIRRTEPTDSPKGLFYKRDDADEATRVAHIEVHLNPKQDKKSNEKHTYFKADFCYYDDIIQFIDIVFERCLSNFGKQAMQYKGTNDTGIPISTNLRLGTIKLPIKKIEEGKPEDSKDYNVFLSYATGNQQHVYRIVPADLADSGYPIIGTNNKGTVDIRGYKMILSYIRNSNKASIETFFPFSGS